VSAERQSAGLDSRRSVVHSALVHPGLESDVTALREWWVVHAPSVGDDVRGLWFGLADLLSDDGVVRHTMYVAGTPDFDPDDGGDWACECVWEPNDRYISLDFLAAINGSDWQAAVAHAVGVVSALRPWETGPSGLRGVGVGFDDGDVELVWTSSA
jgi:hypothetical protein